MKFQSMYGLLELEGGSVQMLSGRLFCEKSHLFCVGNLSNIARLSWLVSNTDTQSKVSLPSESLAFPLLLLLHNQPRLILLHLAPWPPSQLISLTLLAS